MNIKDRFDRYIMDIDYKITIKNNTVNIINYLEIKDFNNFQIKVKHKNGITKINGRNLIISKMQDNEVLIKGQIESVEL